MAKNGFLKTARNYFSSELNTTLKFKYGSNYTKKKNPKLECSEVFEGIHNVNQDGLIIKNGKRKLYVRTFDDKASDSHVKKTGIHRDYAGHYIMNVKNADVKDYSKLTSIIDKALKIK